MSLGLWGGLSLVAIGLIIMWALPAVPVIVDAGLIVVGALTAVLVVLKKRLTPEAAADHEEAAPLHLRD